MVCFGFEPGAVRWWAKTNSLSYGGTTRNYNTIKTNRKGTIDYETERYTRWTSQKKMRKGKE